MKIQSKREVTDGHRTNGALEERHLVAGSTCPFLVKGHFAFQTEKLLFLVMGYAPGGDLFEQIKRNRVLPESAARFYAAEMLLGVGDLHSRGFVHRTVCSDNILIDRDGHIKITEFAFGQAGLFEPTATTMTAIAFTEVLEYMAPEMLMGRPYTRSVDWWSLGIVVYEMLFGLTPFYNENANVMYRSVVYGEVNFPAFVSSDARDLIYQLLQKNPARRLGSGEGDYREIAGHPFFEGIDWDDVLQKRLLPDWVPRLASETDTSCFNANVTGEALALPDDEGVSGDENAAFRDFYFVSNWS
jgi:serine/threonine protein kinase